MFHTVTSTSSLQVRRPNGLFDKSLFRKGDTFQYTFKEAGTFSTTVSRTRRSWPER